MTPTKTIAYFRNGLGNFVLYTPVLQALASIDPSGQVDVCVDAEWKDDRRQALLEIISGCPFVQETINFPEQKFAKNYQTWYWTPHTYPSPALIEFSRHDPRFEMNPNFSQEHEIDYYMRLLRSVLKFAGETPKQFFPASMMEIAHKRKNIAICNGSFGHLRRSKEWKGFPELAEVLKNYYDCSLIKLGYKDELSDVQIFDYNFVNTLKIRDTAAVLKQCDLFVTVDTCNMHVADALNVPMVVIWGGSIHVKNCPVNGTARVIKKSPGCFPCHESGKMNDCVAVECLSKITVGDVMNEVVKCLS